jgi:hypothetical protein
MRVMGKKEIVVKPGKPATVTLEYDEQTEIFNCLETQLEVMREGKFPKGQHRLTMQLHYQFKKLLAQ